MRFGMGAGRWRTCPPPDTGRGMGPARYELSRSDDEGDCGRGRSERSERSSAGGWTPFRTRVYEKGMTSSHIDFLVIPFFIMIASLFNGHAESKFVPEMLAFPEQTMQFWQIVPEFAVFPEQLLKILFRKYCLRHFSGVSSAKTASSICLKRLIT